VAEIDDATTTPEVPLREQILHAFARFGPAWVRFLHTSLSDEAISPSGMRLLSALSRQRRAPIMRDLVNELGCTARAITGLVDTLENEGLVRREPNPGDRRATRVVLTERGALVAEQLWGDYRRTASALFDALSQKDQKTLLRILGVLADELAARGQQVAAPGHCGDQPADRSEAAGG
jgi:DNA-binding MarR family transcriptional regulator